MLVQSAYSSFSMPLLASAKANSKRELQPSAENSADTANISAAGRALQDADAWQTALAQRGSGAPRLVPVNAAIAGGIATLEDRLRQWMGEQGLDASATFSMTYDAASRSFHVNGAPDVKAALEAELNGSTQTAFGAQLRDGYSALEDLATGLAAVRKQYALDQKAGGHDAASRETGFAFRFGLAMQQGLLTYSL